MNGERKPPRFRLPLQIAAGLAVVCVLWVVTYRPDRPIPTIEPGSSPGPAFAVQRTARIKNPSRKEKFLFGKGKSSKARPSIPGPAAATVDGRR